MISHDMVTRWQTRQTSRRAGRTARATDSFVTVRKVGFVAVAAAIVVIVTAAVRWVMLTMVPHNCWEKVMGRVKGIRRTRGTKKH